MTFGNILHGSGLDRNHILPHSHESVVRVMMSVIGKSQKFNPSPRKTP